MTLKVGFKLGGVGGGKVVEASEACPGVPLAMAQGDRTLIEVQSGANAGGEEDEQNARFKMGTVYMMLKELCRNVTQPFQMTGFKVEATAAGTGGSHGYTLTPDDKKWVFQCKDKAITTWVAGNVMREAYKNNKTTFLSCASWAWRFSVDSIHGKLTARKPFAVLSKKLGVDFFVMFFRSHFWED